MTPRGHRRPVRRRGRRVTAVLLVLLVILGGGLIIADRLAAEAAEREIAKKAGQEMAARGVVSPSQPTVAVGGFPFLTQVVGGVYEKITIAVDRPKTNVAQLEDLTITATSVRASASALMSGGGTIVADKMTGTTLVGWAEVTALIGRAGISGLDPKQIELKVSNNQITLRAPISVAGFTMVVLANGTVTIAQGEIRLKLTDVRTENAEVPPLAKAMINSLKDRLEFSFKVPALPYSLNISTVQPTEQGLLLQASADNVKLAG